MSTEKKIKTNIQNSTLNSLFDALSKWHDPHIKVWSSFAEPDLKSPFPYTRIAFSILYFDTFFWLAFPEQTPYLHDHKKRLLFYQREIFSTKQHKIMHGTSFFLNKYLVWTSKKWKNFSKFCGLFRIFELN